MNSIRFPNRRAPWAKLFALSCLVYSALLPAAAFSEDAKPAAQPELAAIAKLSIGDADTVKGVQLAARLRAAGKVDVFQTLEAMRGATPIGKNWLMGLANQAYRKTAVGDSPAFASKLEAFLADRSQDSEARATVFQWLTESKPESRAAWLAKMQDDPSPELRFAAIDAALKTTKDAGPLEQLLENARHPNQVSAIIKLLADAGKQVDQAKHFGFITSFRLIGPFDHVGTKNFNKAFPVETDWIAGKVADAYEGKHGEVRWIEHKTDDKEGSVDLAKLYNNEKGCIVYAMTEFESPIEGPAEFRLGSIIGQKAWVNGKLVMANEVYHSSSQIDQYIEPIQLKKGTNRILIKLCQNEQKESWAQGYQFMVRISDSTGKAIQPTTTN
ncbi:MAG: HEAT repeat domain-containing protein [Pirellula sp.]|nr:HEAT repeat domain-containing protein [Pirellula sp.]